jgi:hypothetical protein
MEFGPGDAPASEADFSFPLHLAPFSTAVLLLQPGKFADALADGDGLNVRNLFQYIKIQHKVTIVPLFQVRCRESELQNPALCGGAGESAQSAAPAPGAVRVCF